MLMLDFIVPVCGNENRASRCVCGVNVRVRPETAHKEIFSVKADSVKGRVSHCGECYIALCCFEGKNEYTSGSMPCPRSLSGSISCGSLKTNHV